MMKRFSAVVSGLDKELFQAINRNDQRAIVSLLERGASLEAKHEVKDPHNSSSVKTYTLLGYAVEQDNVTVPVIRLLLNRGANINEIAYEHRYHTGGYDNDGNWEKQSFPPLHRAVAKNNREKILFLLHRGADPHKCMREKVGSNSQDIYLLDVDRISLRTVRLLVLTSPSELRSRTTKTPAFRAVKSLAEEERNAIRAGRAPDYSYVDLYQAFFTRPLSRFERGGARTVEHCPTDHGQEFLYLQEQPEHIQPLLNMAQNSGHNRVSNFLRAMLPREENRNVSEMQASSSSSAGSESVGYPQPPQPSSPGAPSSSQPQIITNPRVLEQQKILDDIMAQRAAERESSVLRTASPVPQEQEEEEYIWDAVQRAIDGESSTSGAASLVPQEEEEENIWDAVKSGQPTVTSDSSAESFSKHSHGEGSPSSQRRSNHSPIFFKEPQDEAGPSTSAPSRPVVTSTGLNVEGFICPLTFKLFKDPVTLEDGYTYEREAIQAWFAQGKTTSPITAEEIMKRTDLRTNIAIRDIIKANKVLIKAAIAEEDALEGLSSRSPSPSHG